MLKEEGRGIGHQLKCRRAGDSMLGSLANQEGRSASAICCLTPPGRLAICTCGTVPLLGPEMVFQRRSESFFGAEGLIEIDKVIAYA